MFELVVLLWGYMAVMFELRMVVVVVVVDVVMMVVVVVEMVMVVVVAVGFLEMKSSELSITG